MSKVKHFWNCYEVIHTHGNAYSSMVSSCFDRDNIAKTILDIIWYSYEKDEGIFKKNIDFILDEEIKDIDYIIEEDTFDSKENFFKFIDLILDKTDIKSFTIKIVTCVEDSEEPQGNDYVLWRFNRFHFPTKVCDLVCSPED